MELTEKDLELAWAAGLFDGEGCIGHYVRTRNGNKHYTTSIVINQKDPAVLWRFLKAVGRGNVTYHWRAYATTPDWMYSFKVSSRVDVERIIEDLWPYLSPVKLEQARMALGY